MYVVVVKFKIKTKINFEIPTTSAIRISNSFLVRENHIVKIKKTLGHALIEIWRMEDCLERWICYFP